MDGKFSKGVFAVLASVLCSLTSAVYAHTAGGFPSVVPSNQARFHVGVTGMYLRMSNEDLLFATQTLPDNTYLRHYADPDYGYGGRIDVGYLIACTGNDISLNYTGMSSDDDFRKVSDNPVFSLPGGFTLFEEAKAKVEFDFTEMNVEIGQKVDFCRLHTRFHFGLSYACIDHELTSIGYRAASINEERYQYTSEFWGVGPRFGLDLTFPLTCATSNVALVGQFAGSILYSNTCYRTTLLRDNDSAPNDSVTYKFDDECTVVPAGTMRLGLEYTTNSDPACGGFSVAAGWQASAYYHSIMHGRLVFSPKHSNFFTHGAYLTIAYTG